MNVIQKLAANNNWNFTTMKDFDRSKISDNTIIILLPTWSQKDIRIINSMKERINEIGETVYLFDIDEFTSDYKIQQLFPGIIDIFQTPVIGLFQNGLISRSIQGEDVMNF